MTIKRSIRVAERIREEIARALRRDLRDPRIAEVIVTRVEVPDDLQLARVMIRLVSGGADPNARTKALQGLRAASRRLRRQLGEGLGLRRVPELEFMFDEGQDAVDRIEAVLEEIRNDADPSRR
jgi:ribosome-binding factor A